MNDTEKYLFDLDGYIVIEGVLSAAEVARCNEAIDRHADGIVERTGELSLSGDSTTLKGTTGRGDLDGLLGWDKPFCEPFREMLAHPRIVPYLNTIVGARVRPAPVLRFQGWTYAQRPHRRLLAADRCQSR